MNSHGSSPGRAGTAIAASTGQPSKPGKPDIDWDDRAAKEGLVSDLVNDALAVLDALAGPGAPERDEPAADALGLLALVAGQDVEPAEGSDGTDGRWRIVRKVAPDRVISTVDREARHTRKSKSKLRDGFRGHVAAEPETDLITDCEMTMAAGPGSTDAENGVKMAARDRFHGAGPGTAAGGPAPADRGDAAATEAAGTAGEEDRPAGPADVQGTVASGGAGPEETPGQASGAAGPRQAHARPAEAARDSASPQDPHDGTQSAGARDGKGLEIYGDSAYGSGEARDAYRQGGHDTVIKPKPLQPAVSGGFTLDDFAVNEDEGTVTCPAGHTRTMSPARTVTFGALCAGCPLRSKCTTAKDGRSMTIHPHEGLLREARARARTEEFKRAYPTRSMIERVIAWTATQNGRRVRLRYTGTAKNDAWLHNRCAAINLRTLIGHGLTRSGGTWVLA